MISCFAWRTPWNSGKNDSVHEEPFLLIRMNVMHSNVTMTAHCAYIYIIIYICKQLWCMYIHICAYVIYTICDVHLWIYNIINIYIYVYYMIMHCSILQCEDMYPIYNYVVWNLKPKCWVKVRQNLPVWYVKRNCDTCGHRSQRCKASQCPPWLRQ